jgi:hypothetical protein
VLFATFDRFDAGMDGNLRSFQTAAIRAGNNTFPQLQRDLLQQNVDYTWVIYICVSFVPTTTLHPCDLSG